MDYKKTFSEINFLRFRIQSGDVQRNSEAVPEAGRMKTSHTNDDRQKSRHNSNADICAKAVDCEFYNTGGITAEPHGRTANRSCNSTNFTIHNHSMTWKTRFKTQVSSDSDCPSEAMLWIKEVEMVESLDEFKSSRSVAGKNFPNFEMLDAKIASALKKIIQNSQFKKKVSLDEQKAQKEDRFLRGRQIAFRIYRLLSSDWRSWHSIRLRRILSVTLRDENTLEFDRRWDEVLLSMSEIPTDDVLKSLYTLRLRESDQLKNVFEWYDMEIHQKISVPNYQ